MMKRFSPMPSLDNDAVAYGAMANALRAQMNQQQLEKSDPEALAFLSLGSEFFALVGLFGQ